MKQASFSPHGRAMQIIKKQPGPVLALLAFQLLLRLVAFAPMIYAALSGRFLSFPAKHALFYGFLFSLPLVVVLVLPFRFQAAARMAQLQGFERDSRVSLGNYFKWLAAALVRLACALPFLALFLGFFVLFYNYMRIQAFNDALLAIHNLGVRVGGDYPAGIALIGLVGIISAVLAALVWKQGLYFEHQPVLEMGIGPAFKQAIQLRRQRKRRLNRTVLVNILLCLPAILAVMVLLVLALLALPRLGMLAMDFVYAAGVLLAFDFKAITFIGILVALLVLWLPLLPLRKLALSAALSRQQEQA